MDSPTSIASKSVCEEKTQILKNLLKIKPKINKTEKLKQILNINKKSEVTDVFLMLPEDKHPVKFYCMSEMFSSPASDKIPLPDFDEEIYE